MSWFSRMYRAVAAPQLVELLAARDDAGRVLMGRLYRSDRREFKAPDMTGSPNAQQGQVALIETTTQTLMWRVERRLIPEGFLPLGGSELVELPSRPGQTFCVDLDRTKEGESIVDIALVRAPAASMAQHERGSADR